MAERLANGSDPFVRGTGKTAAGWIRDTNDRKLFQMGTHKAYDEPTKVAAIDGEVTLNGPDGVGLSMTPTAASITGGRLQKAAVEAAAQGAHVPEEDADPVE
jgi:hypothetical protein